jgi:hypothetical protein
LAIRKPDGSIWLTPVDPENYEGEWREVTSEDVAGWNERLRQLYGQIDWREDRFVTAIREIARKSDRHEN